MSGAGITGSFVLPNTGGLELKLGPLEEEQYISLPISYYPNPPHLFPLTYPS